MVRSPTGIQEATVPDRFIIAPDPARPGRFYAEHFETGQRFPVPGPVPKDIAARLAAMQRHPCAYRSESGATVVLVEHPGHDDDEQELFARLSEEIRDIGPVCLEPGCFTPAALYCEAHRESLEHVRF